MKRFFYYLTLLSSLIAFVIGCSKEEEELPKLELNVTELTFKSEGGDELVGVTSNTNWSAVSSEKWCEVSPSSSNGNGAIKVSAQKNEKSESRVAKISVVSGSLTRIVMVSQAGSGSENGSGGNNEEGGNGSGNENGGGNGSNNDGDNTPNPTVTYTVTLTSSPIMGGSVTGGGSYDYNSSVTIKATPSTGYVFSEWSDGNTSASRTITVKEDQSLTARFVKEVYKITLNASPSEGGEVSGAGSYDYGTSVILKAIPNEGYTFVRWSDGVTTNPRTITVSKDMSLTANFEKKSNTTFGETNGVEYVDLGLPSGNLWATMNIGADKIEAYGDLYSWGETSTKDNYGENYYSFYKKDDGYTKYVPKDKASKYGYDGFFDNKTTLDLTDDVAHAKLGGSWRMPTEDDFHELLANCDKVWCTYQGVNGYKFTAKNGKWLFLPAAGYSSDYDRNGEGDYGRYWSSSLSSVDPNYARNLDFYSGYVSVDSRNRSLGYSVRAVCPSAKK